MPYLVVKHHHIARVSIEPRVNRFAHAADLVQGWCVKVRPAKFQDLMEIEPEHQDHMLEPHASVFLDWVLEVLVPCGLASITQSSIRSGSAPEPTKRIPVSCENV